MRLTSPAFGDGEAIPRRYTCDGDGVSPPLELAEVPSEAKSLVLTVDDPDAPRGTFQHWLVWNIPPRTVRLPENIGAEPLSSELGGAVQGTNGFRGTGWGPPCPPAGSRHRYHFRLHALSRGLGLEPGAGRAELDAAMRGAVLDSAELTGVCER